MTRPCPFTSCRWHLGSAREGLPSCVLEVSEPMSADEVAEVLGLAVGSVRQIERRALERLRRRKDLL